MIVSYKLGMPNNNSWNGKWSGEGRLYVRTRRYTEKTFKKELLGYHYYNFGDGWGASVTGTEVGAREAAQLRKKSVGFQGYDWMIDSIEKHGKIICPRNE